MRENATKLQEYKSEFGGILKNTGEYGRIRENPTESGSIQVNQGESESNWREFDTILNNTQRIRKNTRESEKILDLRVSERILKESAYNLKEYKRIRKNIEEHE